ncbi:hypothetical protein [Microbulbifer yueqingensis]|uniref:hypothetical protein n=1 Tax=Microbulbifer yueqingensis TaxID=658219 RepID=UPI00158791E7|nr:hypothetical protein [Microbulbifer yueqingensis]
MAGVIRRYAPHPFGAAFGCLNALARVDRTLRFAFPSRQLGQIKKARYLAVAGFFNLVEMAGVEPASVSTLP